MSTTPLVGDERDEPIYEANLSVRNTSRVTFMKVRNLGASAALRGK